MVTHLGCSTGKKSHFLLFSMIRIKVCSAPYGLDLLSTERSPSRVAVDREHFWGWKQLCDSQCSVRTPSLFRKQSALSPLSAHLSQNEVPFPKRAPVLPDRHLEWQDREPMRLRPGIDGPNGVPFKRTGSCVAALPCQRAHVIAFPELQFSVPTGRHTTMSGVRVITFRECQKTQSCFVRRLIAFCAGK